MTVFQVFTNRDFFWQGLERICQILTTLVVVQLTNFKISLRFIKHSFFVSIASGCTFAADLTSIVSLLKHYGLWQTS